MHTWSYSYCSIIIFVLKAYLLTSIRDILCLIKNVIIVLCSIRGFSLALVPLFISWQIISRKSFKSKLLNAFLLLPFNDPFLETSFYIFRSLVLLIGTISYHLSYLYFSTCTFIVGPRPFLFVFSKQEKWCTLKLFH